MGAVIGFLAARFLDRVRNRDARQETVRLLVSLVEPSLQQLRHCIQSFDRALGVDSQAVLTYFKVEDGVLSPSQAAGLQHALQSSGKLDHRTLIAWRRSWDALEQIQRSHEALRAEGRVSGALGAGKEQAYRQALSTGVERTTEALRRCVRHSDSATARSIQQLLGGH